jgi:hypothetical protein
MADVRKLASAKATDVASTKTPNATAAKATHMTSTKATHVASAKPTHASATVSAATATAAAGLCPRGNKAAGKNCACQNHHHSSSHDILHLDGRTFRHRSGQTLASLSKAKPTSRWTGDRNVYLSSQLNSRSPGQIDLTSSRSDLEGEGSST